MTKTGEQVRDEILVILTEAARVRECFHSFGSTMENDRGNDIFIDATKIDAAIAEIRALSLSGEERK